MNEEKIEIMAPTQLYLKKKYNYNASKKSSWPVILFLNKTSLQIEIISLFYCLLANKRCMKVELTLK